MTSGIALLLNGSMADLSATVHAIALAKRTASVVHAVFVETDGRGQNAGGEGDRPDGLETGGRAAQFIALACWLGDVEQVRVHVHTLESWADELLVRFCSTYRIFCLVLGARDREAIVRKAAWFERFRRRIAGERDWFLPLPWSVIIAPWEKPVFEQMLNRLKQGAWSTAAIKRLAGSLQPGLL